MSDPSVPLGGAIGAAAQRQLLPADRPDDRIRSSGSTVADLIEACPRAATSSADADGDGGGTLDLLAQVSGLEFGRGTDYDRAFGRRRQPRQLEQIDSGGERTSVHASIDAFWLWREGAERPKMMSSGLDLRIIGRPRGWPGWSGC